MGARWKVRSSGPSASNSSTAAHRLPQPVRERLDVRARTHFCRGERPAEIADRDFPSQVAEALDDHRRFDSPAGRPQLQAHAAHRVEPWSWNSTTSDSRSAPAVRATRAPVAGAWAGPGGCSASRSTTRPAGPPCSVFESGRYPRRSPPTSPTGGSSTSAIGRLVEENQRSEAPPPYRRAPGRDFEQACRPC